MLKLSLSLKGRPSTLVFHDVYAFGVDIGPAYDKPLVELDSNWMRSARPVRCINKGEVYDGGGDP
jgi:hypothetical protein